MGIFIVFFILFIYDSLTYLFVFYKLDLPIPSERASEREREREKERFTGFHLFITHLIIISTKLN